ncbi:MAG: putative lipoprotein [Dokdonia sp.]|jgi:predicted lipoprotein
MKKIYPFLFLLLSIIVSCNDDESNPQASIEVGRIMQINTLYDTIIFPLQDTHINATQNLITATQSFTDTPSETSLTELREAWVISFTTWKELEMYNFGPSQINFIHNRIHNWPVNTEDIESAIASTDQIDTNYINGLGSPLKGYGAIEYVLFQEDLSTTLSQFTTAINASQRREYVLALVINLEEQAEILKDTWVSFESEFKSDLTTSVSGSQNKVINALIAHVEFIKNTKIEDVLNANPADVELLEAYYSEQSKEAIVSNLKSIRATYTGDRMGTNGFGIEEYLTETLQNSELNTEILNAINTAETTLSEISGSLEDAVISNPTQVKNLQNSFSTLITLFKADLASAANIIVTFSDNDGD